ncbi:30S ribosomal protein S4e [uncultured archaeon]|nr:30S ribosomal protein S4e [uncultured archaeon]
MHTKRNSMPKFWPIARKGTKYLAVASHNNSEALPLIIVLRDILKIVENKKEAKKIINEKQVKINNKEIRDVNYPICIFDVITLSAGKSYKAVLSKTKKMIFEEVSGKDAEVKIFKVMNKKIIDGKKVQLNLMHGKNIISSEKVNTGDSVILNFKENKIVKIIPMEKGKEVFVTEGKHAGNKGKIEEIVSRGGKSIAKISSEKGRINVWIKNVIALG